MRDQQQLPCDEDLARRTQAGSLTAFDELIVRYHRRIYAFVAQSCAGASDASQITQDTFVKAFQAIGTFDPRRSFAAWLFTIARRKAIDHHRAARPIADTPLPDLADGIDPAEQLARQEERQTLWDSARRLLPEAQFHALWLKYAEDMSVATIAQILHKTQTHVKVLLFRARRALARELGAAGQKAHTNVRGPQRTPRKQEAQPYTPSSASSIPLAVPIRKQLL